MKIKHNLMYKVRFVLLSMVLSLTVFTVASAASEARVMQAVVSNDESTVKAYVRGALSSGDATYQISNVPTDAPVSYPVSDDPSNMRTLIMVDNSLSIPQDSRPDIKDSIKGIINGHGENELFRLATFSDRAEYLSDQYSGDYTALLNMVDSIEHMNQETYLTDVLYDVIDELNMENYEGYTRIVIFSDGVDNKPIGVTREELNRKLDESPYPVYTFGCSTGKNDSELENMFALSRLTGCEYLILERSETGAVSEITSKDKDITVFEAEIPEGIKVGGRQSSKLTLPDGTELVFNVDMPFSIKDEGTTIGSETLALTSEQDATDLETETEPAPEPQSGFSALKIIAVGIISLLVVAVVLMLIMSASKKGNNKSRSAASVGNTDSYQETEILGASSEKGNRGTERLTPGGGMGQVKRYRFSLTDVSDPSRSFSGELIDQISVGRLPDNNIIISDDKAVHGHHAVVTAENDVFKYADLKTVRNNSSIDGVPLSPGIPKLIVNNSKITIGKHTYVASVSKQ